MRININGKAEEFACEVTLQSLKNFNDTKCDLTILNGFQTEEDVILKENDRVTLIKKGEFPNIEVLESMMMARHTPYVHQKVKAAHVGIAGLGGLGSNIAVMLARMGVGHLTLIDFDVVEPSNLNRQSYYIRHLGMYKTEALAEQIREINPFVKLSVHTKRLEQDNILKLLEGCDIVCEAFDKAEYKALLVNTLMDKASNMKIVAASGMAGYDELKYHKDNESCTKLIHMRRLRNRGTHRAGAYGAEVRLCDLCGASGKHGSKADYGK